MVDVHHNVLGSFMCQLSFKELHEDTIS